MKSKIMDEIKRLVAISKRFIMLNIEYAKLTAAEKFTMLAGMMAIGILCLACSCFILIFLGFACVELFKLFMTPALAYLSTAGIFLVIVVLLILLRKPLVVTPISRMITRILFGNKSKNDTAS